MMLTAVARAKQKQRKLSELMLHALTCLANTKAVWPGKKSKTCVQNENILYMTTKKSATGICAWKIFYNAGFLGNSHINNPTNYMNNKKLKCS